MDRRLLLATFVGGILAGVAGWLLWPMAREQERTAAELMDVVMWGKEPIGGPFTLIDHEGKLRTDTDFRGKLLLVYFGFTACADACPTDLAGHGRRGGQAWAGGRPRAAAVHHGQSGIGHAGAAQDLRCAVSSLG